MGGRTLVETYSVAGRRWELKTNSEDVLAAARASFPDGVATHAGMPDLRLRIHVSEAGGSGVWTRPVCRGRDHLAFCSVGEASTLLFDYRRRLAIGSVTRSVAGNARYWREVVFPFAVGVMSPVLRTAPLHAACIRYRDQGVLIGARSGAGKSTLSATLARRGIEFISDDWVYLTADAGLRAHALPVPLKLLPDASTFFPELQSIAPAEAQNGEWSIGIDPAAMFGCPRGYCCEPRVVILFDRVPGTTLQVREATGEELLDWFSEPLDCVPDCLEAQRQEQMAVILALRSSRCYVVTCDGTPDQIADRVLRICDGAVSADPPQAGVGKSGIAHLDLLRRGVPVPYANAAEIAGIAGVIRTNDAAVLEQFRPAASANREFEMTVIVEPQPWPEPGRTLSMHESDDVGYVSLGADGLIAFDSEARAYAAFVSQSAAHERRLHDAMSRLWNRVERAAAMTS